ncbi:MAG: glycoside hydrolase family 28 protein [Betaproteobacteria bacterium]
MRQTLVALALLACGLPAASGQAPAAPDAAKPARLEPAASDDPWQRLPGILARIHAPVFPDREFPITDFGAVADGETDATLAFRSAIEACSSAGGGHVIVPPGVFLTGPIQLKSNVDLHVSAGATVRFSRDPARYLPVVLTRFEGVELMGYSPLVYAHGQKNVALTGEGTLDGQADGEHWWPWKGSGHAQSQAADRKQLFAQAEAGVPVAERVYGAGHYLRPQFVEPYACTNVLIEGVTITNSPMWVIHPVLSRNVIVRGVKVVSAGPNNDGCDPESSTDVLIENALFDTGDDCIAIKSGRNADGRRLAAPAERIVVRGCRMRAGHGGVTIGSEVSGSVRDVFVERNTMSSPQLERGIRVKTNAMRGGVVENLFVRDVEIEQVGSAIDVDMLYEEGAAGSFLPVVRNLSIERMDVRRARHALSVRGLPASPVRSLLVRDSRFRGITEGLRLSGAAELVLRNVVIEPAPSAPGR